MQSIKCCTSFHTVAKPHSETWDTHLVPSTVQSAGFEDLYNSVFQLDFSGEPPTLDLSVQIYQGKWLQRTRLKAFSIIAPQLWNSFRVEAFFTPPLYTLYTENGTFKMWLWGLIASFCSSLLFWFLVLDWFSRCVLILKWIVLKISFVTELGSSLENHGIHSINK